MPISYNTPSLPLFFKVSCYDCPIRNSLMWPKPTVMWETGTGKARKLDEGTGKQEGASVEKRKKNEKCNIM